VVKSLEEIHSNTGTQKSLRKPYDLI